MNNLKWKTPKGLVVVAKVTQNGPRRSLPAQVKARIWGQGHQLVGVRQKVRV